LGRLSAEKPELSELLILWEDREAFRLEKNDRDASRLCLVSFGEGGYWGIAVKPGVAGSGVWLGDSGVVMVASVLELLPTGRIVEPLVIDIGDDGEDLGDRGERGLSDASGFKPSAFCDSEFHWSLFDLAAVRSKFGTLFCLEGILFFKDDQTVASKQQGEKVKIKTKIPNKIVVTGKPDNTGNEGEVTMTVAYVDPGNSVSNIKSEY
jgi:hypothetical protein